MRARSGLERRTYTPPVFTALDTTVDTPVGVEGAEVVVGVGVGVGEVGVGGAVVGGAEVGGAEVGVGVSEIIGEEVGSEQSPVVVGVGMVVWDGEWECTGWPATESKRAAMRATMRCENMATWRYTHLCSVFISRSW